MSPNIEHMLEQCMTVGQIREQLESMDQDA